VRVLLDALEIARGHDGLLRGAPDPVLITAVYATRAAEEAVLLARSFKRLRPDAPFPSECGLSGAERSLAAVSVPRGSEHLLVLIAAVEEDSVGDIAEVFAALSDTETLSLWRPSDHAPEPRALGDAARHLASVVAASAPEASRVEVLHAGVGLHDRLRLGAWIGAGAVALSLLGERPPLSWRMRFASADARNDWTARVEVSW